jgi:2-keto-4-pentenoate hydratase/2-oxohepta-3-ene-1,7-dioic acid hydratase in catechol pathway
MRVLRVRYGEQTFYGSLVDKSVLCLDKALGIVDPIPLEKLAILPPVVPTKIICAALNYRGLAEERGKPLPEEPILFMKPPSAVISTGQAIILPPQSTQVNFEGELAVVIGKTCRNAAPEHVAEHLFGFCCANDVTARDLRQKDVQYTRAKSFDTFAPIGPWIETQLPNLADLSLRTLVNGEIRQDSPLSDMIFSMEDLVSFISGIMTLNPGDVVLTGTPSGVGPIKDGDEVRIEIPGVGILVNPVISAAKAGGETVIQ